MQHIEKHDCMGDTLRENVGGNVTLILESGFHLTGKLLDFDPWHIKIETPEYSADKKTTQEFLQNRGKVSGMLITSTQSKASGTKNEYSHHVVHLLSEFMRENCKHPITMFMGTGYILRGTLEKYDSKYAVIHTRAYGTDNENNPRGFVQALSCVSGFLAGSYTPSR